ncbi:hypothetical protein [Acinetobacter baumannii]|uniref:hypothetical protein n=1 Tax=Acinetobacter baumannii TaxID=470 RepID=UPI001EF00491|nr:hypothetical protein [Acinetobacter baumannii]MCG6640885.1 hypothetical protein [Acinetobacter baumannii]
MKKIFIFLVLTNLVGCSNDKPKEYFEGGFDSMENCIRDVKIRSKHTPVVELMNDTKVSGSFDGLKRSQGIWTCEIKQNKTGYPFYGFFSIEKDL